MEPRNERETRVADEYSLPGAGADGRAALPRFRGPSRIRPDLWLLIVTVLLVLLLLNGDRLADLGKGLGAGTKAFKKSIRESEREPPRQVTVVALESKPLPSEEEPEGETQNPSESPKGNDPREGS